MSNLPLTRLVTAGIMLLFIVIILYVASTTVSGVEARGTETICAQKVKYEPLAYAAVARGLGIDIGDIDMPSGPAVGFGKFMAYRMPNILAGSGEIFVGIITLNPSTILSGWDTSQEDSEPEIHPEKAQRSVERVVHQTLDAVEEVFHLGPECGSIIRLNATASQALGRLAEEVDICSSGTRNYCVFTFELYIRDAPITECNVSEALAAKYPNTWGDYTEAPNDGVNDMKCDGAAPVKANMFADGLHWNHVDLELKPGKPHYFSIIYSDRRGAVVLGRLE